MRSLPLLLVTALAPAVLAQAPRVTPAGDPSVRGDTIYALAVNPADYPDQPYVYLLDDGVVRFEADGRGTRTYRQVIQILTREAAEQWGEQTFSYLRSRERLTVNWVRVLLPSGEAISERPSHEQESDAPVAQQAPVYSDQRIRRVSLGGVAPGALVDWSYTVETREPVMTRDFYSGWSVTTARLVRRSRLIVDVPASVTPRIDEVGLNFARRVTEAGGRRVYVWATQEVPRFEPEPFPVPRENGAMGVTITAPITWGDIARWYAGLARDRYALTPALEARLAEVVAGARTLDDSLRAVHRWVAQDFRYVSLSLGIGGYRPRRPAEVLEARYGDCKDKATLFIALVERLGARAYPVLLSAGGGINRDLPSVSQFDHMIAAVERPGGYLYADLTADLVPYGTLPPSEQGEFALVVHPDGRGEEVTLPEDSVAANRSEVLIAGEISADGIFTGRLTRTASGSQQYALRDDLTAPLSETDRQRVARNIASGVFDGAAGDSLELFDGRDLSAVPRIRVAIRNGRATSRSGNTDILTLPINSFAETNLIAELESRGPRRNPIHAEAVFGPMVWSSEFRVGLPAGWRARLPAGVTTSSAFGSYRSQYAQEGRELRVTRVMEGSRGRQSPEKMAELIGWLRAVSADDVRYVVLER